MGDLSEHFSRWEFACRCGCGMDLVDTVLHQILVDMREYFVKKYPGRGIKVTINSGCRCLYWNEHEDGSEFSQHMEGKAADAVVNEVDPPEVYQYLIEKYNGEYGFKWYTDFVHIDCRVGVPWRG